MVFDIFDADGPTGCEAETYEAAQLACITLANEGYTLPLEIIPEGERFAVAKLVGLGNYGRGEWVCNGSTVRQFDGRAA
jgi:hypothetical protein